MDKLNIRSDDFASRRKHLQHLSDEELKEYFWNLANQVVDPLIELAKNNTTPAIERSVLLRMGFSSLEAKVIVEKAISNNLVQKGAGHLVYRLSKLESITIREAGLKLINDEGWEQVKMSFEVAK